MLPYEVYHVKYCFARLKNRCCKPHQIKGHLIFRICERAQSAMARRLAAGRAGGPVQPPGRFIASVFVGSQRHKTKLFL